MTNPTNPVVLPEHINLNGLDLVFEITRFCNMECPHCLRGEAQKLRIKKTFINKFFENTSIEYISTMTLSGGEPSLAVDLINYIREVCEAYGIEVQNFYLTTNGTNTRRSFLNSIKKWLNFCSDNEISSLRVSKDNYHDEIGYNLSVFQEWEEEIKYEISDNFYLDMSGAPNKEEYLIYSGRAKDNYPATRQIEHDIYLLDDRIEGAVYINAKGFIVSTCDIDYDTMDEDNSDFVICHVSDPDIKGKFAEWFNNHPDRISDEFLRNFEEILENNEES